MGWSWALHIAQSISSHALLKSGFPDRSIIVDKRLPVVIDSQPAAASYVDNYLVVGTHKSSVFHAGSILSIKPDRLWRMHAAITELLKRRTCAHCAFLTAAMHMPLTN
eukprot:5775335-Karenia_brevis.AAC.1